MIKVKDLKKSYGDFLALNGISFSINKKGITGLLGPNGAGKTTTMKILTGFLSPTEGEVEINNLDLKEFPLEIKAKIGYLPENNPLYFDMTVEEYLFYIGQLKNIPPKELKGQISNVIESCSLKEKYKQEINQLSKGYKQRVGLAQSLLGNPDILILDEPTVGLDPNQIVEIRQLIKKIGQEKVVIFSSHILAEVEAICDNVLIINKGKIVAEGTAQELRNQAQGKVKLTLVVSKTNQNLKEDLKTINGVKTISSVISPNKEEMIFEIETDSKIDVRRSIIKFLAGNSYDLLELSKKEMKLEDVFSYLTK